MKNKKKLQSSWMLYDFGNSAFATTIMAAVLPVYYANVAASGLEEGLATSYWGYSQSISVLIVAVLAPILGAISDYSAAKKKFLQFLGLWRLSRVYNRLRSVGKYEHPINPNSTYKKFYSTGFKTFKIATVYLFPIGNVKTVNAMNLSPTLSLFTEEGRKKIYDKLKPNIESEISVLMNATLPNRTVEYIDNRISRFSMKMGKCEITG